MAIVSSCFLVICLWLAVAIGPQTREWSWGPALLSLAAALGFAVPSLWKRGKHCGWNWVEWFGGAVLAWFSLRAFLSPVRELALADALLLAGASGGFLVLLALHDDRRALRVFFWGIALLLAVNVAVIAIQVGQPAFAPLFWNRAPGFPSGFYAHYNEAANFLIGASCLVGGAAAFGPFAKIERAMWAVIAAAGAAAVYFTHSRGGILAMTIGAGVFATLALVLGRRDRAKWFAPVMMAVPLLAIGVGIFLWLGWSAAQEARAMGETEVVNNPVRLWLMTFALSCIGLHPWAGGGSRSFSWECYAFWQPGMHDKQALRPEVVHNEWLQAATDYGLIGVGLLTVLVVTLVLRALVRTLYAQAGEGMGSGDALRIGGTAALIGMFVQSCFSPVFHLFPGILLFGLALGCVSANTHCGEDQKSKRGIFYAAMMAAMALVMAVLLLPSGWKGSRVTLTLWETFFANQEAPRSVRVEALSRAIDFWPLSDLHKRRAAFYQQEAGAVSFENAGRLLDLAIADYAQASRLHAYEPAFRVNLAMLLSLRNRVGEADREFREAIRLQGNMELLFRAHLSYDEHLQKQGVNLLLAGELEAARMAFSEAVRQVGLSREKVSWMKDHPDYHSRLARAHAGLGAVAEAQGDAAKALLEYEKSTSYRGGERVHFRMAELLQRRGKETWEARNPEAALRDFLSAKRHLDAAKELPSGATAEDRRALADYLDQAIRFLEAARVMPAH